MLSVELFASGSIQSKASTTSSDRYDPFSCTCIIIQSGRIPMSSMPRRIRPVFFPLNSTAILGGSNGSSWPQLGTAVKIVYRSLVLAKFSRTVGCEEPFWAYVPVWPALFHQEGFWSRLSHRIESPGWQRSQNAITRKMFSRRTLQRRFTFFQATLSFMPVILYVIPYLCRHRRNHILPAPPTNFGRFCSSQPCAFNSSFSLRASSIKIQASDLPRNLCISSTKNCRSIKPSPAPFVALWFRVEPGLLSDPDLPLSRANLVVASSALASTYSSNALLYLIWQAFVFSVSFSSVHLVQKPRGSATLSVGCEPAGSPCLLVSAAPRRCNSADRTWFTYSALTSLP